MDDERLDVVDDRIQKISKIKHFNKPLLSGTRILSADAETGNLTNAFH